MKNIPTPEEDLLVLSTRWLEVFEAAARAQDEKVFKRLFHPEAILFGVEKGGAVDWPLSLGFTFDIKGAKIVPLDPFALVIASWTMQPLVVGGGVKRGRVTFLLGVEGSEGKKGSRKHFLCSHAHFSLRG